MEYGNAFEYLATGSIPRDGHIPEIEKVYVGTKRESISAQYQKIIESALLLVFDNDETKFKSGVEQYKDVIEKNASDDDGTNPFAAVKYAISNFKDKKGIFKKFVRNGWSAGQFKP
jgi:hypothetical protein